MKSHFKQIKQFFETYERLLMPATLILGTAVDFVTFRTLNVETTFWILGIYYVIAAACIGILNTVHHERLRLVAKFLIQFTFGALLSSSLVFYWFSGVLSVSWPIMILLALLMVSNEVFNQYYLKPIVQIGLYYFVSFSLLALYLPYALNSLEPTVFLSAGVLSFVFVWILLQGFSYFLKPIRQDAKRIVLMMATIFVIMLALYFGNIIPPIPLSLREAGVYHSVTSVGGSYRLQSETESWLDRLTPEETIHVKKGQGAFVYTAIFAPTKLNTVIYHAWEFFDETQNAWVKKDRFSYPMSGGRDAGYRGYSKKSRLEKGKWRVNVETARGQVLARVLFRVEIVESLPMLVEEMR